MLLMVLLTPHSQTLLFRIKVILVFLNLVSVEKITWFDPLTGKTVRSVPRITIYPKSHYVTPRNKLEAASHTIRAELEPRLEYFRENNKLVEAQRLTGQVPEQQRFIFAAD